MIQLRVCRTDEVAPGELRGFDVDGLAVPVMIANVDGTFYAATSMCPHEDVSLLGGSRHGTIIVCPGHAYEFDLRDGRCGHTDKLRLKTYRVRIVGNELFIRVL